MTLAELERLKRIVVGDPRFVRLGLRAYDAFVSRVGTLVDLPQARVELLWRFVHQIQGKLSTRARTQEFALLTDAEVGQVERFYEQAWQGMS